MPPSGFNKRSVEGALLFIKGCYEDLLQEVGEGKHSSVEEAIKHELNQIESALSQIHVNARGQLVARL